MNDYEMIKDRVGGDGIYTVMVSMMATVVVMKMNDADDDADDDDDSNHDG